MTDVPSVLLLCRGFDNSLSRTATGARLAGVGRRGAAGSGRQPARDDGFYAPWLVLAPFVCGWKFRRRQILMVAVSCLFFFLCALGWFAFWFITDAHYRWIWFGWRESMRQETARHPVTLHNLKPYLAYFFVSAPLVFMSLPFALWNDRSEMARAKTFAAACCSPRSVCWRICCCIFNYSTAVNWRYFLTGLPAIAPLCANFLIRILTRRFRSARLAFVPAWRRCWCWRSCSAS